MKKVLITGGAGFIGSHLVEELLKKGYKVCVLDNLLRGNKLPEKVMDNISFINGDVRDYELVKNSTVGCNMIFHLSAYLGVDMVADEPIETMNIESFGTNNIVEAAIENNVEKIIYASTSGVYGKTAIEASVKEDFIVDPRSSYSIAKRFNEILLAAYWQKKQLNSVSLRYFNVYGERQDNRMVIPRFFEQAISNEPITVFGNGKQTRDFTYVKDVAKATVMLAENVSGCEIFNICGENEHSIYELGQLIKTLTKSSSEISLIKMPGDRYDFEVERRSGDSSKLKSFINYFPQSTLENGLKNIYKNLNRD